MKQKIIRTLGEKYDGKKIHSWVWWSKIKAVLTGLRKSMRDLEELRDHFRDGSENLSGEVFLQELVAGSNCDNNFGSGRTTLQSGKILQLC